MEAMSDTQTPGSNERQGAETLGSLINFHDPVKFGNSQTIGEFVMANSQQRTTEETIIQGKDQQMV